MGSAAAWKRGLQSRASSLFASRGADLAAYVYGTRATVDSSSSSGGATAAAAERGSDGEEDEEEGGDDFFTLKGSSTPSAAAAVAAGLSRQQQQQQQQQQLPLLSVDDVDGFDGSKPFFTAAAAGPGSWGVKGGLGGLPSGPGFNVMELEERWADPDAVQVRHFEVLFCGGVHVSKGWGISEGGSRGHIQCQ